MDKLPKIVSLLVPELNSNSNYGVSIVSSIIVSISSMVVYLCLGVFGLLSCLVFIDYPILQVIVFNIYF